MNCFYLFRGKKFNSELELDEYLLTVDKLAAKYGDIVFSGNNNYQSTIIGKVQKLNQQYQQAIQTAKNNKAYEGLDDRDIDGIRVNRPHVSVTDLIHEFRQPDKGGPDGKGTPLFPIFIADEYWSRRFEQLRHFKTSRAKNEIKDYDIPFIYEESDENDPEATKVGNKYYHTADITDETELNKIRERMTKTWEQQSKYGTAVHNIAKYYFLASEKTRQNDDIFEAIRSQLSSEDLKYLPDGVLQKMVQYCRVLEADLKERFPKCKIFPEQGIVGTVNFQGAMGVKLVGKIDLLVISETGEMNIIDFKCSPHKYAEYDPAKKNTFNYQLAVYQRVLRQLGIGKLGKMYVAPLQFQDYRTDFRTNISTYSGLEYNASSLLTLIDSNPGQAQHDTVQDNLDEIFPPDEVKSLDSVDLAKGVDEFMTKNFPEYVESKQNTQENVKRYIDSHGGIKKIGEKQYIFKYNKSNIIKGSSEEEVIGNLMIEFNDKGDRVANTVQNIKRSLKEYTESTEKDKGAFMFKTKSSPSANAKSSLWISRKLGKYANDRYEIIETDDVADSLGLILIKNKNTGVVDVIKVCNRLLDIKQPLKDRNTLLGNYMSDVAAQQIPESLVMENNLGNIQLMEAMAAVGILAKDRNLVIGSFDCINPHKQLGIAKVSNKQLLYNYSQLCRLGGFKNDFQQNENESYKTKLLSAQEIARADFEGVMKYSLTSNNPLFRKLSEYGEVLPDLDKAIDNPQELLRQLTQIKNDLETEYPHLKGRSSKGKEVELWDYNTNPEYGIYFNVLDAIAELNGIDLVQQCNDHDKYLEGTLTEALKGKGWNGSFTDNPGTLKSANLNKLASLVERAYQNTRQNVSTFAQELKNQVEKLKKSKSFGLATELTVGNQANLYTNLYDEDVREQEGEFKFKSLDDSRLTEAEREFLYFITWKFAEDRRHKPFASAEEFETYYITNQENLRLVPLVHGDLASSVASAGGLLNAVKNKLKLFDWKYLKEKLRQSIEGFLTDEEKKDLSNFNLFKMTNSIEYSVAEDSEDKRMALLTSSEGISTIDEFEHNLETLALQHHTAYTLQTEMNNIFPVIKAIEAHINMEGLFQNTSFEQDLEYLNSYIKNKIFNMPVQDVEKWSGFTLVANKIMSVASKLALAFNVHSLYQFPESVWKNISLYIKNPDGKDTFSLQNMKEANTFVLKDLIHFSNEPTLGESINALYGINDMDMNTYAQHLKSDNCGIFNFWSLGFRFASRPDYYNRMTIFISQMKADGCFDAHSINPETHQLEYDWTKDKRFDAYAKGDTKDPRYNQQRALYQTMAQEFVHTGAKNPDGSLFVYDAENPKPLPRAYTTKQSESMKALGDKLYGYYAHEKRSMIQATTIGAMFMQMNTFWSSKKNQYLSGRGFTQEGDYVQYEEIQRDENGEPIKDEDGNEIRQKYYLEADAQGNLIPTTKETAMPLMVWKGRTTEGIAVSCANFLKAWAGKKDSENKGFNFALQETIYNQDPDIRRMYRANFHQLWYDFFIFAVVGGLMFNPLGEIAKKYVKETGNADPIQAMGNTALLTSLKMLSSSTDDFNALKSIFGKTREWTPFSIQTMNRLAENIKGVMFEDRDMYDAFIYSTGATRNTKPIWDYVKINTLGRSIGQKATQE